MTDPPKKEPYAEARIRRWTLDALNECAGWPAGIATVDTEIDPGTLLDRILETVSGQLGMKVVRADLALNGNHNPTITDLARLVYEKQHKPATPE